MEEHETPRIDAMAARSAEALRGLHAHAEAAASSRRERLLQLESQLSRQLEEIAAVIAHERAADDELAAVQDRHHAEFDALRHKLDSQASELAEQRNALAKLEAQLAARGAALDAQAQELATTQATAAEQKSSLDKQEFDLERRSREFAEKSASLTDFERNLTSRSVEIEARSTAIAEQAAKTADESKQLAAREAAAAEKQAQLEKQASDLERATAAAQAARAAAELTSLDRESTAAECSALMRERDELRDAVAKAQLAKQSLESKLAEGESRNEELTKAADQARASSAAKDAAWRAEKTKLDQERDSLKLELATALQRVQAGLQDAAAAAERDELKQKFALALDDVQRFRTRVAALEQELAERPAAGQADSPELVSLRAERDALAERIDSLERATPTPPADDQQLADLQRRFELAVEDVRELKTKNAQLESQLAAAKKKPAAGGDAAGMDWESQKRRLLASLEGGDGADELDEVVQEERATIASTIQITDAVIVEKDQEIAELKAQLAAKVELQGPSNDQLQQQMNELLDADKYIQKHRELSARHEQELEAKLRAAELEMSVARAKLAREKVELEQLRHDLTSEQNSIGSSRQQPADGVPKRRWLSKLGLGNEGGG